jgi:hypothetical protein
MAEFQITLSADEREYLGRLLQVALKETRIEEHRTRTPTFRDHIVHQEEVIVELLRKLGQPSS